MDPTGSRERGSDKRIKMKILVIEDNADNLKLVMDILDMSGYDVLSASDAPTGIDIAHQANPKIILMDIQLSGMNGLEATRILKQNKHTSHIKIIAMTAMAMRGDKERILRGGCDGYITKPIRYKELLALLKSSI